MATEKAPGCEQCKLRAHAERKPNSFLAWLWRLHTKICPGWKSYQKWLAEREQQAAQPATDEPSQT